MADIAIEPRWLHEDTLAQLRGAKRAGLIAPRGFGKTRLLDRLAERDDQLVVVGATRGFDQVERMVLDIGAEVGEGAPAKLDEALGQDLDRLQPALNVLDDLIGDRQLVIDDLDALIHGPRVRELSEVLAPRRDELLEWLHDRARIVAVASEVDVPEGFAKFAPSPPDLAPWRVVDQDKLADARWWELERDNDSYRAALAYWKLHGEPPPARETSEILEQVWEAIPPSVQQLMGLLACYYAKFPAELLEQLVRTIEGGPWALTFAGDALLIEQSKFWFWLSPLWQRFVPSRLEGQSRRTTHLRLANFFAERVNEAASLDPRALQAAHRHFVQAEERHRAGEHLRYGVGLFLAAGRAASLNQDFGLAEQYYATVLELSAIKGRSRGYARHYYHYNRYKDQRETIRQTERGYHESLRDYRDNGLFWSRLIVARFQMDQWAEALQAREQASKAVPKPSAREKHLLGRTVTKLLERGHDNAAVVVWGDAAEISDARAKSACYALERRGEEGWSAELLRIPGLPDTVFERSVKLIFTRTEDEGFRCRIREARVDGRGASMLAAMRDAVQSLRAEALAMLRQGPEQLDPKGRMRKRELLGLVDVLGSALRGPEPGYRWLTGRVELDAKGHPVFVPLAAVEGERYTLAASLSATAADKLVDAKVETGPGGVPRGPVLELVDPFADSEKLDAARAQLDELLGG